MPLKSLTRIEMLERFNHIHGDKYVYDRVETTKQDVKVEIGCPTHGYFLKTIKKHLEGQGCQKCSKIQKSQARMKTTEKFIEDSRKTHGDTYDYSRVNYTGVFENVIIICRFHGEFPQTAHNHERGHGCPNCAIDSRKAQFIWTRDQFIESARRVHGDLYDYEQVVYVNYQTHVNIMCQTHGVFPQTPHNHVGQNAAGCPSCHNKTEGKLGNWLRENYIDVTAQFTHDRLRSDKSGWLLRYDFMVDGIVIELDGSQHFQDTPGWDLTVENVLTQDVQKMNKLLGCGFDMIRIRQEDVWMDRFDWKSRLAAAVSVIRSNPGAQVMFLGDGYEKHAEQVEEWFTVVNA